MRRTAVTGVGVVAPGGVTRDSFWENITAGRTATRRISFFDPEGFRSQIAAEADFDPIASGLTEQEARRMDRYIQFAAVAAMEAMTDAALLLEEEDRTASRLMSFDRGKSLTLVLEDIDRDRMAVTLGSAVGGTMVLEDGYIATSDRGREWLFDPDYTVPFLYAGLIPSSLASEIAVKFGAHGPAAVISTGCTSGIDAIGYGHQLIQDGEADVVISGASESPISPISMACFDPIKATSSRNDDPEHASRPFDADRDGFVIGEGASCVVLESLERARARGATMYGEVAGYGRNADAYHITAPSPGGAGAAACMQLALDDAALEASEIGHVNAHGTSTELNDAAEAEAVRKVFGDSPPPVTSTKGVTGHLIGAAGATEAVASLLAIEHGQVPPTANHDQTDPEIQID